MKEVDEWLVLIASLLGTFYVLAVFFGVPVLVSVPVSAIVMYFAGKLYGKYSKEASPGFLIHFFYDIGLYKPKKIDENDIELPYGFERRFKD